MTRTIRFTATAAVATALGFSTLAGLQAQDSPEAVVEYRQLLMSAQGAHAGDIASIVKGEVGYTDHVVVHAQAIHELSKLIPSVFPEDTGRGTLDDKTTRALPKIWEDWEGFEEAANKLTEESAKLIEVAKDGDAAAIAQQFAAMGKQGCGGCHDSFRGEEVE